MAGLRELFLRHVAQTSEFPLSIEIEKAEGIYMYGPNEERYIDLISGIGVSSVGHSHPNVVNATKAQIDKHMHLMVYGEFVQSSQVLLGEKLATTLPGNLQQSFFVNSGSEATEGALKLAKKYTGRSKMVSLENSYHGATHGALSINGSDDFTQGFGPMLPEIEHIRHNNIEDLKVIDEDTACFFMETVMGEAGIRVPSKEYMTAVRNRCSEVGALLILDEVQCGAGRTGTFWSFEQFEIVPDIITAAKGIGGGMPIGMFISSKEIMSVLTHDPILGHITTFGGHPVSCAASLAAVKTITEGDLLTQVPRKSQLFKDLLQDPDILEIRGLGLMLAIQMESFDRIQAVIKLCIEKGLVTDWFLYCDDALRVAPPLVITDDQIEESCAIILEAIEATRA